jgi:outer membrane lipoprotein-sorting protein
MRHARWIACALLVSALAGRAGAGDDALADALRQVSKATRGLRALVADVDYTETVAKRTFEGTGTLHVHVNGMMRVDVQGDLPRTVLLVGPLLHVHRHHETVVEIYDVVWNPNVLGQYAMLGFAPAGKELKKDYDVQLVPDAEVDGAPALSFLMKPKSKEAAAAVARIQLWVDPQTGLPLKHEIVHVSNDTRLSVRYRNMKRQDDLPGTIFRPEWPAGTTTVRK